MKIKSLPLFFAVALLVSFWTACGRGRSPTATDDRYMKSTGELFDQYFDGKGDASALLKKEGQLLEEWSHVVAPSLKNHVVGRRFFNYMRLISVYQKAGSPEQVAATLSALNQLANENPQVAAELGMTGPMSAAAAAEYIEEFDAAMRANSKHPTPPPDESGKR